MRTIIALLLLLPGLALGQTTIRDETTDLGRPWTLTFTGGGVTCTGAGSGSSAAATCSIPGDTGMLPVNPTPCDPGKYVTDQDTSGTLTCEQVAYGELFGIPASFPPSSHSHAGADVTSTVATAAALAADGADCSLPNVALGVNASGAAACAQPSNVTGNAATATNADQLDGKHATSFSGVGACGANTWASTLNGDAAPTCTQPAFSNLSGSATVAQGGTGNTTSTEDAVLVGSGTGAWQKKTLSGCTAAGSKIAYDAATNAFSCQTSITASALALSADPADCSGNNWARGIGTNGAAACAQPAFTNISGRLALNQFTDDDAAANATRVLINGGPAAEPWWGQVDAALLAPGAVDWSKFADGVRPIKIVTSNPALPDASYPEGTLVYNSTDDRLYRSTGAAWGAAVGENDLAANSITAGKIASSAIGVDELGAGTILASILSAGEIGASHIAANAIETEHLSAGAVTADELASNAVSTHHLQAGSITADKISARTITADRFTSLYDMGNLWPNGYSSNAPPPGHTYAADDAEFGLRRANGGISDSPCRSFYDQDKIVLVSPAEPGETYALSGRLIDTQPGWSARIAFDVEALSSTATVLGTDEFSTTSAAFGSRWTARLTMPADTVSVRFTIRLVVDGGAPAGVELWRVDAIVASRELLPEQVPITRATVDVAAGAPGSVSFTPGTTARNISAASLVLTAGGAARGVKFTFATPMADHDYVVMVTREYPPLGSTAIQTIVTERSSGYFVVGMGQTSVNGWYNIDNVANRFSVLVQR